MRRGTRWKTVPLGPYVDIQTGYPFKSREYTGETTDIKLLRGDNIIQGRLRWEGVKRWSAIRLEEFQEYLLQPGDVVLAMDRPWIEAGLKYAWITDRDLPCLLVQRVARLRGLNGLLTGYVRYLIGHHSFTDYVKGIWTGVAVPHISESQIRAFHFPLPPTTTQEQVIDILSAYDDLIENNTRRIKILEEMARMVYREWFLNFRFPGHEKTEMVRSKVGSVPKGWQVQKVTEAVDVDPSTRVSKEGLKPFVSMGSLSSGSMLITDIGEREGNSGSKFRNGDTLFARITPCLENGKTGFVQFLPSSEAVAFGSTEFIVLRSRTVTPEYVYLMARSDEFRDNAIKSMSGATGRQRVQEACFDKFLIAHPPTDLLQKFQELATPIFRLAYILNSKNENLRTTRDLLLPKLISGEIEIGETQAEAVAQSV